MSRSLENFLKKFSVKKCIINSFANISKSTRSTKKTMFTRLETILKTIQILNLGRKTLSFKARKIITKINSDFIENLAKRQYFPY